MALVVTKRIGVIAMATRPGCGSTVQMTASMAAAVIAEIAIGIAPSRAIALIALASHDAVGRIGRALRVVVQDRQALGMAQDACAKPEDQHLGDVRPGELAATGLDLAKQGVAMDRIARHPEDGLRREAWSMPGGGTSPSTESATMAMRRRHQEAERRHRQTDRDIDDDGTGLGRASRRARR